MKPPGARRPLFSILLIAAATTLTLRVILQLKQPDPFQEAQERITHNATLLRYAATDLSEPKLKQEIDELLDGSFKGNGRHRSFLSSGKYHIDFRVRTSRGLPVNLRSPEFYRLWLDFRRQLQDWSRKRKLHSTGLEDSGSIIRKLGLLKPKYPDCAVVGNSGILLKSFHGEVIDKHAIVIRLNNARTRGFEPHVGSKTTLSFINSNILHLCAKREGCYCHPYGDETPIVMYICQPAHFFDHLVCNASHKAPLIVTDPRFDSLCSRIVKYYSVKRFVEEFPGRKVEEWGAAHQGAIFHYSSGMQAVMLAVAVCEKVSLFGFGKSGSAKHHYHTNQKGELGLHDYEAEYDFYRDLICQPWAIPFVRDGFVFPRVVMYR